MDLQATMADDSKERLGDGEELGENKETMDEDKGRMDESEGFGENKEKVEENKEKVEENKAKIGESKEIMVENEERIGENMEKTGENKASVVENIEKSGEKKVIVVEHIEKTGENNVIVAGNKAIFVESKEKMGENNGHLGEKEKTGEKKGMKEQRMEEEDGDKAMMVAESTVASGEVDNRVEVVALGKAERESKLGVVVGLGVVHEPNDCATDDVSNRLNGQATIASSDFAQLQPHSSTQHLDNKTISVYDDSDVESGEIRSETENVDVEMMESYGMDSTSSDSSSETSSSSDSEDTEVEKKPTHQLERIATVQSSQGTNEVDNDSENEDEGSKHSNWHENELQLPFVPPIEEKLEPHHVTVPVGVISSVFGSSVVVEAIEGQQPLNEGSILWLTDQRSPLGYIDEIFGPVKKPFYVVRHNDPSDLPVAANVGTSASYVPDFATFVLNVPSLYKKGYDASGENDQELSEAEVEFSDDEREAEYKRLAKSQSKRGYADSKDRGEEEEGRGRRGGNPRWQRRGFEKKQRDHEDTRFASSHIPKQNQVPSSSPYPNSSNSKQEPIRAHSSHLPPRKFRHNGAPSPKEDATMPKQSFPFRHGSHCNTEDPCNKEKPMQNTQLPSPSESHHMDRNILLASSYENSPIYVDGRSSGIQYQHQIRSEELNDSPGRQQGVMPNPSLQQYEHQIRSEEQKQSPRQQGVMPNPSQQQYQHQIRSEEQKQSPRQQGVMPNPSHQQYQHQIRSEEQKQSPRQQGVVPNPSQQHQHQIRGEEKHHTPRQQGVMSNLSQQFHQHQIRGEESNHTHLRQQGVMPNPSQQQYQHQIWSEEPNHTHPRQQGVMRNPLQQQYQHQIRSEERNRTPLHPHAQSRFGMAPNNPNMNHPQMGVVGDVAQGFPIPFPNQTYHSPIAQPNNVVGTVIGVPAGPINSYPSNFMQGPYQGGGHAAYMQPPPPQALNMNIAHPYREVVRQPKLTDPEEFPSRNFWP